MVGVPFWEIPFEHISACLDIGPRSDYVTTALAARMMVPQGSGVVINISSHGAKQHLLSVPYGVGKGGIDKLTQDTATELRAHGVAVVSLWPGLVLTEGLLANAVVAEDGTRTLHGLDISFGETPKFNGLAVVALAVRPEDHGEVRRARSGRAGWPASTGSPRTTVICRPRSKASRRMMSADDVPDYWRGVERYVSS